MQPKPLVLDLDGTLTPTDLLYESFWAALGRNPAATLRAAFLGWRDRAALKARLAELSQLRCDLVPLNEDVAEMARTAQADGHEVVIASASDTRLVTQFAVAHGMQGRLFGSTPEQNLKGQAKADALTQAFGARGFHYAGNEAADRPVWRAADQVIVVGGASLADKMRTEGRPVTRIEHGWSFGALLKSLRPHQWLKNVLLFLPMLAAHAFALPTFLAVVAGIIAFSAAASSIYIVNDLLDLEADRLHPKKRFRPFAAGTVPIKVGMIVSGGLIALALGIAASLGAAFLGVIVIYMTLSLAYSLKLKRMRWVDIATLATLYTLRVVAGAAAGEMLLSSFMLIFVFPIFITLGCVKRLTELTLATSDDRLPGRGYGRPDRGDLLNMAGLGTVAALVIFFLYSFSDQAQSLYPTRWLLWVAMVPIALWLLRMVRLGWHGEQDYDPIVFAMRDKRGLGLLMIALSIMFYAAGLWQEWFGF